MTRPATPGDGTLLALDAGIDDLSSGAGEEGLLAVARCLAALPDEVWDEVAPLHQSRRRELRRHPVLAVAAALVLLAVLAGAGLLASVGAGPPNRPAQAVHPGTWRLAGYIDQPAWTTGDPAGALGGPVLVTCAGGATCYAVEPGSAVVEASKDGGSTWSPSTAPGPMASALSCPTAQVCAAATGGPAGPAVGFTTDGGATWSSRPAPTAVTNLSCSSATVCVALGNGASATAVVALHTADAGSTWTMVPVPDHFIPDVRDGLSCPAAGRCVAAGVAPGSPSAGAVRYSADGGASWSVATLPAGVALVRAVSCADAAHCVAVGNGVATAPGSPYGPSEALTSSDGGRSWSLAGPVLTGTAGSLSCPVPGRCWAAGHRQSAGLLAATTDGGASWSAVGIPAGVEYVGDISCPTTGDCVAVGSATTTVGQIVLRPPG
ncbi:MAG: WD40/YVTN/BNR-like repeat-containing protein [Acidimicrobiales bacterium]